MDNDIKIKINHRFPSKASEAFELKLDLTLPGRGVTAIFGPSGCGKTSILRSIAGLLRAAEARISVCGEIWQDNMLFIPTYRRALSYVFQESSLFPHLTVKQNIDYAVKRTMTKKRAVTGISTSVSANKAMDFDDAVSLMGLEKRVDRYPHQLSGGEQQRVAIARALLVNSKIMMMDEPLSSLDLSRKREILPYLETLRRESHIPMIYVSHSTDEVARLADHLVVLEDGQVLAHGPLNDVLTQLDLPIAFSDEAGVVLEGKIKDRDRKWQLLQLRVGRCELWVRDSGESLGETLRVRIPARDVSLALNHHDDTSILNKIRVKVDKISRGKGEAMALVSLKTEDGMPILARVTYRSVVQLRLLPDMIVWAQIKSVALIR